MKNITRMICGIISGLGLLACQPFDIDNIKPGTAAVEVRGKLGEPGHEWKNSDGSLTWEYSQQPSGKTCYMINIDAQQKVTVVEQVITEQNLARIGVGWSQDQVRRVLGKPRSTVYYKLADETVWDWNIPTWEAEKKFFNVHFGPDATVTRTSTSIDSKP